MGVVKESIICLMNIMYIDNLLDVSWQTGYTNSFSFITPFYHKGKRNTLVNSLVTLWFWFV